MYFTPGYQQRVVNVTIMGKAVTIISVESVTGNPDKPVMILDNVVYL